MRTDADGVCGSTSVDLNSKKILWLPKCLDGEDRVGNEAIVTDVEQGVSATFDMQWMSLEGAAQAATAQVAAEYGCPSKEYTVV
jgi:hypothetical protein